MSEGERVMADKLRPRQQEMLKFIGDFMDNNGWPPTVA